MKKLLAALALFAAFSANAEISPNAKQEIAHLFTHLKTSGCEFNRNGTWYNAEKAVAHLNQKYEYLLGKKLISTTEDFIVRAASESSMSHQAYLVKCGDKETKSAVWFKEALTIFRSK
ncbi:MAG TPA: DUF5329 domain-containing protein [Methylotenera sp.]|nr:DUF5329 domain-containing protein [Methylotenera sp.]HPH06277.1 DUF5329 domain-containing protein [Methylotenera sp.]HPN00377.1 DUF5329 domain-containing protein [Methylotenera sp.]